MYVSACSKDKRYSKFNREPTAYITRYVPLYVHKLIIIKKTTHLCNILRKICCFILLSACGYQTFYESNKILCAYVFIYIYLELQRY